MATTTPRLTLRKPQGVIGGVDDIVNVQTDIADSMDKIDTAVGGDSGIAFPGSPFPGKFFVRTDQGMRLYWWSGTAWLIMANGPDAQLRGTSTSIPNNVDTAVPYATEVRDSDNGHDPVTNNSRYTFPFKGIYAVTSRVGFANDAASTVREVSHRIDGSTVHFGARWASTSNIIYIVTVTNYFNVNAGQWVETIVNQNSGSALALSASGLVPTMDVMFMKSAP